MIQKDSDQRNVVGKDALNTEESKLRLYQEELAKLATWTNHITEELELNT